MIPPMVCSILRPLYVTMCCVIGLMLGNWFQGVTQSIILRLKCLVCCLTQLHWVSFRKTCSQVTCGFDSLIKSLSITSPYLHWLMEPPSWSCLLCANICSHIMCPITWTYGLSSSSMWKVGKSTLQMYSLQTFLCRFWLMMMIMMTDFAINIGDRDDDNSEDGYGTHVS